MNDAKKTQQPILLDINAGIGTIRLNRPQKRNAMNVEMIRRIQQIFLAPPPEIRAFVIEAEGDHFSGGLDLSEHVERSPEEVLELSTLWHRATQLIVDSTVPVICALQGHVIGAGLELAVAAHVRFIEPNVQFSLPEGRRGIFVGGGASVRVGKLIGASRMIEMMLSGRRVGADEALRIGLCQRYTEEGQARQQAHDFAVEVSENAPLSNRMILLGLANIAEMPSSAGLFTESLAAALTQTSPEAVRRINSFLADSKRK